MIIPSKSLTALKIAQMIDISAVRANSIDQNIKDVVGFAKQNHCYLVTILPSQTAFTKSLIGNSPSPKLGGNVGFPSGGQTTSIKVQETRELVELGVDEIDMVINISAHLSGRYDQVYRDITAVVEVSDDKPVKVILECYYLNDDQIRRGCDLAIKAGAAFVKTGTGWTPTGATLENVTLIKNHVGDAIQIKASGGIREVDTLLEMYRRGACRFGISLEYASSILASLNRLRQPIELM
jgi:deoxyribose-phosphate aldolase